MKPYIKIFCIIAFIALAKNSEAQTKEETVKWLTEKMMKDGFFKFLNIFGTRPVKITTIDFDDNFLTINGFWRATDDAGREGRVVDFQYEINLAKLPNELDLTIIPKEITLPSHEEGKINFIRTNGNHVKVTLKIIDYEIINEVWKQTETEIKTENRNYLYNLVIANNFEPDIIERFTKALKHYISLMTVKKSTETF